jgi:hypothetical protein
MPWVVAKQGMVGVDESVGWVVRWGEFVQRIDFLQPHWPERWRSMVCFVISSGTVTPAIHRHERILRRQSEMRNGANWT